jgi:hypothetical protein
LEGSEAQQAPEEAKEGIVAIPEPEEVAAVKGPKEGETRQASELGRSLRRYKGPKERGHLDASGMCDRGA